MESSKYAGKVVRIKAGTPGEINGQKLGGELFKVQDYWVNLNNGVSWRDTNGNWACINYAMRLGANQLDIPVNDDKVLYGHVGAFGHLIHESEIEEVEGE